MDDATVEILLTAKNESDKAFEEASLFARNFKEAIESVNKATAEGTGPAEALKLAMGGLTRGMLEAGATFEEVKFSVNSLRRAMEIYFAAVAAGMVPEDAFNAVLLAQIGEMQAAADATDNATAAEDEQAASQAGLAALISGVQIPAWLGMTAAIAAATAALSPFIILVGSAIVIGTAFAVAATGMALAVTGATLSMVALAAGVVLIADKFAWVNNSMGHLKADLKEMGADLAQLASGPANRIIYWLDGMLPRVEAVGASLIRWLDPRLPAFLNTLSGFVNSALGGLGQVGSAIGSAIDHLSANGNLNKMFQQFTDFGAGALVGLIQNLTRLSDWFEARLPKYGPIAEQIFGAIGSAVQGVAYWWGKFSDFLADHWPQIVDLANRASKSFGDAWAQWSPELEKIANQILPLLPPLLKNIADNFGVWAPIILAAAAGLLIAGTAILAVVSAGTSLLAWLENAKQSWNDFEISVIQNIRGIINAYNQLPGVPQIPLPDLPGQGGSYSTGGRTGGSQTAPGGPSTRTGGHTINVTNNINGAQAPQVIASTISRNLRKIGAV